MTLVRGAAIRRHTVLVAWLVQCRAALTQRSGVMASVQLAGRRLLLVEDELMVAMAISTMLCCGLVTGAILLQKCFLASRQHVLAQARVANQRVANEVGLREQVARRPAAGPLESDAFGPIPAAEWRPGRKVARGQSVDVVRVHEVIAPAGQQAGGEQRLHEQDHVVAAVPRTKLLLRDLRQAPEGPWAESGPRAPRVAVGANVAELDRVVQLRDGLIELLSRDQGLCLFRERRRTCAQLISDLDCQLSRDITGSRT